MLEKREKKERKQTGVGFFSVQRGPEVRRRSPDLGTAVAGLFVTQTVLHHGEQMSPVASAGGQTPSEEARRTAVLVHTRGQCQSPQCRVLVRGVGICSRRANKVHWNMKNRFSGSLLHSQHASLSM